jgi:hypothetical protein
VSASGRLQLDLHRTSVTFCVARNSIVPPAIPVARICTKYVPETT